MSVTTSKPAVKPLANGDGASHKSKGAYNQMNLAAIFQKTKLAIRQTASTGQAATNLSLLAPPLPPAVIPKAATGGGGGGGGDSTSETKQPPPSSSLASLDTAGWKKKAAKPPSRPVFKKPEGKEGKETEGTKRKRSKEDDEEGGGGAGDEPKSKKRNKFIDDIAGDEDEEMGVKSSVVIDKAWAKTKLQPHEYEEKIRCETFIAKCEGKLAEAKSEARASVAKVSELKSAIKAKVDADAKADTEDLQAELSKEQLTAASLISRLKALTEQIKTKRERIVELENSEAGWIDNGTGGNEYSNISTAEEAKEGKPMSKAQERRELQEEEKAQLEGKIAKNLKRLQKLSEDDSMKDVEDVGAEMTGLQPFRFTPRNMPDVIRDIRSAEIPTWQSKQRDEFNDMLQIVASKTLQASVGIRESESGIDDYSITYKYLTDKGAWTFNASTEDTILSVSGCAPPASPIWMAPVVEFLEMGDIWTDWESAPSPERYLGGLSTRLPDDVRKAVFPAVLYILGKWNMRTAMLAAE